MRSDMMALVSLLTLLALNGPVNAGREACAEPLPDSMRVVQLDGYGGPNKLALRTVPLPAMGEGDVLVRVRYASINPVDWKLREGGLRGWWPLAFPAVLGRDISGDIVRVGKNVTTAHCGEAVSGFLGRAPETATRDGGYAEYVALDERRVVLKPKTIDYQQAAAYPLVGVTAWMMVDLARVSPGDRVLVHGGAGGVGSMAVQIAKDRGAHVITTASARNHAHVTSLGAAQAIDYTTTRFEDVSGQVDVVLDTVGGDTLERSPAVLKDGGRLVSVAGDSPSDCGRRIVCPSDPGDPDLGAKALKQLSEMIEAGRLSVHVDHEFPLDQVGEAQELNRQGHTRGKIVVRVSDEETQGRVSR